MYIFKFSLNSLHNHLDWLEGFFIALFSVPEIKTENALINWHFDFFFNFKYYYSFFSALFSGDPFTYMYTYINLTGILQYFVGFPTLIVSKKSVAATMNGVL